MPRFTHKLVAALAAATMLAPAMADAQRWRGGHDGYNGYGRYERGYDDGRYYGRRGGGYNGYDGYDRRQYRRAYRGGGRGYCRDKGTGGTILGAIAGGLLGNEVAGRGDRTTGAIVGAGVGALAGRAIDRDC